VRDRCLPGKASEVPREFVKVLIEIIMNNTRRRPSIEDLEVRELSPNDRVEIESNVNSPNLQLHAARGGKI